MSAWGPSKYLALELGSPRSQEPPSSEQEAYPRQSRLVPIASGLFQIKQRDSSGTATQREPGGPLVGVRRHYSAPHLFRGGTR